jgi:ribosomal protein L11 methyltransferase
VSWIALRITPDTNRDGVIAALFDAGSQGVQEDGVAVVTHFPPETEIDHVRSAVMAADPRADIAISDAPDVDYSEWRAAVGAHRIGRLVIAPPWLAREFDPSAAVIIDPVMAFGTGEHATTRGVLRLMQGIASRSPHKEAGATPEWRVDDASWQAVVREGDVVADLGAGSAVLSIAAAKLGASRVVAIEIDHDSIANAEDNVRANGVAACVSVMEGDAGTLLPLLAPVRVILANIISSVLLELLPAMRSALDVGGQAILSGILREERENMLMALVDNGWTMENEDTEDAWWSVQIAPR